MLKLLMAGEMNQRLRVADTASAEWTPRMEVGVFNFYRFSNG
jgi:hypothetical protein